MKLSDGAEKKITLGSTVVSIISGVISIVSAMKALIVITGFFFLITIMLWFFFVRNRKKINDLNLKVRRRIITTQNQINSFRSINENFKMHEAINTVTIEGNNLEIEYELKGIRLRTPKDHKGYIANFGADRFVPYDNLVCFAYDLIHDKDKKNRIRPDLVSEDGNAKQILIPFAQEIPNNSPFHIYWTCVIPDCMNIGEDYYVGGISYPKNRKVDKQKLKLIFKKPFPAWVKLYEVEDGKEKLIKQLFPEEKLEDAHIFIDEYTQMEGYQTRIYFFER